jgi:UTP--glucose-1-phosphate uridylyltransferase
LLADDLIINDPSATQQLINVAQKTNSSVIGLNKVPKEHIGRYGVISSADVSKEEKLFLLDGIIEKPQSNPPSDMAVFGRYVLSHHIFNYLEIIDPGVAGEIQLTDAIKLMLKEHDINGYLYDGIKFDCGSKEGYVQAIAHLASDLLPK